jgi:hypothetical protein
LHLRNKYDKLRYDTLIFEDMKERITMRVGMGYDVHKLVEGRRLILGGVEIPYEKGLLGHSDADENVVPQKHHTGNGGFTDKSRTSQFNHITDVAKSQ